MHFQQANGFTVRFLTIFTIRFVEFFYGSRNPPAGDTLGILVFADELAGGFREQEYLKVGNNDQLCRPFSHVCCSPFSMLILYFGIQFSCTAHSLLWIISVAKQEASDGTQQPVSQYTSGVSGNILKMYGNSNTVLYQLWAHPQFSYW